MSGALVGFRIDGEKKLSRLHGEHDCEGVLSKLLAYLRGVDDTTLRAYARALRMIGPEHDSHPTPWELAALRAWAVRAGIAGETPRAWAEVFAAFPDLTGWHAGLPFMPAAPIDACGDVSWGFLLDLDADELQIFVNRHGRFHWHDMACGQPAYCTLRLDHARQLTAPDLSALHGLLLQHAYSDGSDPILPLRDAISAPFPGPGAWQTRLQLARGRVRLLLERGPLHARIRQVGELRLDDPYHGAMLRHALAWPVLALTQAIYGLGANLGQVTSVATNLLQLPFTPEGSALPLLDLGLRPACGLGLTLGASFFDAVRARFLAAGMSAQGWRFLVRQDNAVLRCLLQFLPPSAGNLDLFARLINLLASALQHEKLPIGRCQPALRGVERILDRPRIQADPVREENARLFLRAIARARLSARQEANLAHEAQDVSDFVHAHPGLLGRATWASLCRRSDNWHRKLLIAVDPAQDVHWPALLPRHAVGPFVAVELNSGYLLAEDGLQQRHCIGTYANACASGATRVFSLRRQGKRVATIELQRRHDGAWQMVQMRGKANSPIHDETTLAAGEQVTRAYCSAARAHEQTPSAFRPWRPGEPQRPAYLVTRYEHWTG